LPDVRLIFKLDFLSEFMEKVINLYKPVGMTPLQAIERFRVENPEYKGVKIGYAGRLDPMAEGVLILLIGDENKKINEYFKLGKEYKAEILFGFSSDSYDVLGLVKKGENVFDFEVLKKEIEKIKGEYEQTLPIYSSYKIKGKPLFYYARENRLSEIDIPKNKVCVKKIKIDFVKKIGSDELLKKIVRKIDLVNGDFRQEAVKKVWKRLLVRDEKYFVVGLTVKCSSGTYIRAIANDFGLKIGCGGILLNLIRTKVGKFKIKK